ncbi:MAG: gamma-glutamyl-gamma-aminobutyrate hydrolase family protein [Actinomycetota bacterium]|nr:gamma-glutamyl-gamma-aminobutyrate hydrolase family protein [Actinomycetota bacterium]
MDSYPNLLDELWLIRDALKRRLPILGVCLGSQLLAHALGAEVEPADTKELGWGEVKRWTMPSTSPSSAVGPDGRGA